MTRPSRRVEPSLDALAGDVHRLAVLLAAGVPPPAAWSYLEAAPGTPVGTIAEKLAAGSSVPEAMAAGVTAAPESAREGWAAVAAAWAVATEAGAPLAPTLVRLAGTLRAQAQTERDVLVALAGPAATRRLVLWLPAIGVLFGLGLGFDPLATLLSTPAGLGCVGVGSALMLLARVWTAALIRGSLPGETAPGLDLELIAIAVSGSGSVDRALMLVREHGGLDPGDAARRVLDLSVRAGVPAAELLRAEADRQRRAQLAAVQVRVARLGVTLLLPLGVCVLPAFLALAVAPLVLSVVGETVGGL
jgi:tight adherence protein B